MVGADESTEPNRLRKGKIGNNNWIPNYTERTITGMPPVPPYP